MEPRRRIRRSLALVSAVVLIAVFVLYRAGFGASTMSGSKSTFIFVGSSVKAPEPTKPAEPATEPQAPAKPGE